MRFNKQELVTLATQPSSKFEKEGVLHVRERQEGFFRKTESKDSKKEKSQKRKSLRNLNCVGGQAKVSLERWCRLRGNLLFYFKSKDPWSEPIGVVVLEHCQVRLDLPNVSVTLPIDNQFPFYLVFDGGLCQALAATSDYDRSGWMQAIKSASYEGIRAELHALQQCIERKRNHRPVTDLHMWRIQRQHILDMSELPLCEVSLACDNLLCDGHGRPPNPTLVIDIYMTSSKVWVQYACTEVIERSSNPGFLSTVSFRASDGLSGESRIRFTVFDVRERVSQTAIPLGSACVLLSAIQDSSRLRITLLNRSNSTIGFLTISAWALEAEDRGNSTEHTPCRIPPSTNTQVYSHRRSQSLPPRLGVKMRFPNQAELKLLYASPYLQTYRFHSGLGGDICVHELMAESRLCFLFPHQLVGIWIHQEKELLQEVAGMGELREPWHSRQVELLDRHLHLLRLYSQARENLQAHKGSYFKASSRRLDRSLEFAPINLHLQRMWVHNDTLNKSGFYDWLTVGAFTAHSHKSKNGGLIKLVQQIKESPIRSNSNYQVATKISMANDAIQAIKQLRKEVVEAMKTLMRLAKEKQTIGMLPICEDMIKKTRILLSLWDPSLVEEALSFIEEHKLIIAEDSGICDEFSLDSNAKHSLVLSPFKRITQQLTSLDLKSPDMDEFATPCTPKTMEDVWKISGNIINSNSIDNFQREKDGNLLNTSEGVRSLCSNMQTPDEANFVLFPECDEFHNEIISTLDVENANMLNGSIQKSVEQDCGRLFLDTNMMSSSPSANYYKPTDEPEPWDLTQLNIEASVMCLVSKVKFLCGRCGSPAVRLRQIPKGGRRTVITNQPSTNKDGKLFDVNKESETLTEAVNSVTKVIKNGNKFTDGLDLNKIVDWVAELRPSMRKLRQAMDGLLKTARLTHSVFRVQQDPKAAQRVCNVQYRRDVCFSQALTSLVTALMTRLWCHKADPTFITCLSTLGPLASFECLLSYHGHEIDMWGDMSIAVEDLRTVMFTLSRCPSPASSEPHQIPKITGNRNSLTVSLPVPDALYSLIPSKQTVTFHVTPVFFNIGINEMATLAESIGATRPQERSNIDNYIRLNEYYLRYKKLNLPEMGLNNGRISACTQQRPVAELIEELKTSVHSSKSKNVEILHLASQICRQMKGIRFTSCKSAKDRTGMSITLEQCQILSQEYHLAEHEFQRALDCMRSEGCRRENTQKNTNVRKYAFNSLQLLTLPKFYRPPAGTYGSAQT